MQTKKKRKFNIIDILFILMIVLIAFVGYKFLNRQQTVGETVQVVFDVEFRNKDLGYADEIEVGMLVSDSVRGGKYGVVQSVIEYPDYIIVFDQKNEEFVNATIPDKYRVKITVAAEGRETEKTIVAGDEIIKVGQEVYIKGKGFASEGFITDLEVIR